MISVEDSYNMLIYYVLHGLSVGYTYPMHNESSPAVLTLFQNWITPKPRLKKLETDKTHHVVIHIVLINFCKKFVINAPLMAGSDFYLLTNIKVCCTFRKMSQSKSQRAWNCEDRSVLSPRFKTFLEKALIYCKSEVYFSQILLIKNLVCSVKRVIHVKIILYVHIFKSNSKNFWVP